MHILSTLVFTRSDCDINNMKVSSAFCALFLMVVTALAFFNFLSPSCGSWFPDLVATKCGYKTTLIAVSRKLKENGIRNAKSNIKVDDIGHMTVEDYSPNERTPVSKASMLPAPIEHGSPLIPFIPKPSPPDVPSPGNFN